MTPLLALTLAATTWVLLAVGVSWTDRTPDRTCTSPIQINISVTSVMEFRQDSDNYLY